MGKTSLEKIGVSDADRASRTGFVMSDAMAATVNYRGRGDFFEEKGWWGGQAAGIEFAGVPPMSTI